MNQTVLWDSQMKAQKLKQGMGYIKSAMYCFDYSKDIIVEEEQQDNNLDRTILHYMVRNGDRAYFSEEYLPEGMLKEGIKKPDITAILEQRRKKSEMVYL